MRGVKLKTIDLPHEMLNVPILAECSDHTLFNWTTAGAANGNAHFVMATQTIQFVHIVGRKSRTTFNFTRSRIQFNVARRTIKVIAVIDFATETQRLVVDDATASKRRNKEKKIMNFIGTGMRSKVCVCVPHSLALVAHVFAQADRFDASIAVVAQCTILISNESTVGQLLRAQFAAEALRMPIGCHRLDYATNNKFAAFIAARREQYMKVAFTIFSSFEFVEDPVLEGTEALSATEKNRKKAIHKWFHIRVGNPIHIHLHEALRMPQFTVRIDNLLVRLESLFASRTKHIVQRHTSCHHADAIEMCPEK